MVELYSLSHPITNEIRYIGKANNAKKRLKSHLRDSKIRNTPVYCWIRSLFNENLTPKISVLKKVDVSEWKKEEINLISEYKNKGVRLLNVAIGGDEPFCSKETRANNGRNNANSIHSNPDKKRIWRLKKQLRSALNWLEKNNRREKRSQIINRLSAKGIHV